MSNQSSTLHIYVTFMDKGKILIKYSISWLNLQLPFSSSFKIKRKIALTITLLLRLGKTTYIKSTSVQCKNWIFRRTTLRRWRFIYTLGYRITPSATEWNTFGGIVARHNERSLNNIIWFFLILGRFSWKL